VDPNDSSTAALYQVWVHPEARGRAIGQRLLDSAMSWAREVGAMAMVLSVATGPDSALEFYRRAGFAEIGETTPLREGSILLQQQMRRTLQ
jgi:ribosomal protein S18 acetylase RimI-like enzyme